MFAACIYTKGERNRNASLMQDDVSDHESCSAMKMICPDSDDYKLVFISSDSSSLDEIDDSESTTSSTNNAHSISLDDCDWDYFEPSATTTTKTIFRDLSQSSPFVSPNLQRRHINISETDEEFLAQSSSPTSSDGFVDIRRKLSRFKRTFKQSSMSKSNACSCHQPQYVAIPVPVPIFVIGDDANNSNVRAIQTKQAAELFQLWNNAAPDLLLAHQQRNGKHLESHTATIANDFLKNYAEQCKTTAAPLIQTSAILTENANEAVNHCVSSSSSSSGGVNVSMQKTHENVIKPKQEEILKATTTSALSSSRNDCSKYINTLKATHNDSQEQSSIFSTGDTFDHKTSVNNIARKANTTFDVENLNRLDCEKDISRHFVGKNDIDRTVNRNSAINDVNLLNCVRFSESMYSGNKANISNSIVNGTNESITSTNSNNSFNLISEYSGASAKINLFNGNVNNTLKSNNKYRNDSIKCNSVANKIKKQSLNLLREDNTTSANNNNNCEMAGYLRSESMVSTSSCDSDEGSNDNEHSPSTKSSKSIKRNYDVVNAITKTTKESDSLVSGSSDCEDLLSNSAQEQPSCSSAPEASDSDDNTNLHHSSLADRRPKSKGFYKVFVVNKKPGSSDSDSQSTNVNSTDDSSDNDTDTEQDCGIVLNYIKPLSENSVNESYNNVIDDTTTESYDDIESNNEEIILCSIKRIDDDSEISMGNDSNQRNTTHRKYLNLDDVETNDFSVSNCNEHSSDDENNKTVIEKMPIAVQPHEQIDLHIQSTIDESKQSTTIIDENGKSIQRIDCMEETQLLSIDDLNSNAENVEYKSNEEMHFDLPSASTQECIIDNEKELCVEAICLRMNSSQENNEENSSSDKLQTTNTIEILENDPVSVKGVLSEQPVHCIQSVDDTNKYAIDDEYNAEVLPQPESIDNIQRNDAGKEK